jgi:hypothetical protein
LDYFFGPNARTTHSIRQRESHVAVTVVDDLERGGIPAGHETHQVIVGKPTEGS